MKSNKINENILFILENSELLGQVQLLYTMLLSEGPYKSKQEKNYLPQTVSSTATLSIKILNSISRLNLNFVQHIILTNTLLQESLYCVFTFLINYSLDHLENSDETKELLHETLLLIGYICILEPKIQALMLKGEVNLIRKISSLPFNYFFDKKLKEILMPTMISMTYDNKLSMEIINKEIDISIFSMYLKEKISLEPIVEEELDESFIDDKLNTEGKDGSTLANSKNSVLTLSSMSKNKIDMKGELISNASSIKSCHDMVNGVSDFLNLTFRFPRKIWERALEFYSKYN